MSSYTGPYFPIGEVMARPRNRIARVLRFFDWCSYEDLAFACQVGDGDTERDTFAQGLYQALKHGEVEKRGAQRGARYRVTTKGRDRIKDLHDRYERNLGEGVAA